MLDCEQVEAAITGPFRGTLWEPFCEAIRRYGLIAPGDRVAVCISGGKDSMLLAKLMQLWQREAGHGVQVRYLVMDPGYNERNRRQVELNARHLGIPFELFESSIFEVSAAQEKNPCYLCAKMRRGTLYRHAQDMGCNKIALGHHFNDVIETTVMAMLYGGQLQAMAPKLQSKNFEGMALIRPLYLTHEEDIISWRDFCGLTFIQCACRLTERAASERGVSKRAEVKELLARLEAARPGTRQTVFEALHHLETETLPVAASFAQE